MELFAPLPADLSALDDSALREWIDQTQAQIRAVQAAVTDPEAEGAADLGDLSMDDVVAQMETTVENVLTAQRELAAREEAAAAGVNRIAELAGQAGVGSDEGDGDEPAASETGETAPPAEGDEEGEGAAPGETPPAEGEPAREGEGDGETAETPESVAASARPQRPPAARRRSVPPRPPADREGGRSDEAPDGRVSLVAGADIRGFQAGQAIRSHRDLAVAFMERHRTLGRGLVSGDKVPVASIVREFPDDRVLTADGGERNLERIQAVTAPSALTAAGGLCAPLAPLYDLPDLGESDAEPVRGAVPDFNAERGGITFPTPMTLADVPGLSMGVITAAEDAAIGSTVSQKTCARIDCPPFQSVEVDALYRCLEFGNLPARTYPELVERMTRLTMVAYAAMAETKRLDEIDAASTQVTAATLVSATVDWISQIIFARAGFISRHRLDRNTRMRVLAPEWAADLLVNDLVRSDQTDRFSRDVAGVTALLEERGVNIVWYKDTPTGAGQVLPAQGAGALNALPSTVAWFMYPEGSFIRLDAGTIDLGLVRDSNLNATNDFQVFFEAFEAIAFVGAESLAITSTFCDNGKTGGGQINVPCAS